MPKLWHALNDSYHMGESFWHFHKILEKIPGDIVIAKVASCLIPNNVVFVYIVVYPVKVTKYLFVCIHCI